MFAFSKFFVLGYPKIDNNDHFDHSWSLLLGMVHAKKQWIWMLNHNVPVVYEKLILYFFILKFYYVQATSSHFRRLMFRNFPKVLIKNWE